MLSSTRRKLTALDLFHTVTLCACDYHRNLLPTILTTLVVKVHVLCVLCETFPYILCTL